MNNLSLTASTPTAQLALELATHLYEPVDVFRNHGLSKEDAKALLEDPQFRSMVREYRKLWNSPMNATERVRLKSAVMVEDGLLELHRIFHDQTLVPAVRLDAFKQAVGLSDLSPKQNAVSTGERFSLTINMPSASAAEPRTLTIEATPELSDSAGEAG